MASAQPSTRSTSAASPRGSEVQAYGNIRSDITAWQSALQSLPPEFATATLPSHPLAQALADQPTLRPVEWNVYRQQGGFVPRTPHDYSSLMIFISGLVNPNPCRNCLLRNGPFARCVVAPPPVLAISTLRHACANCTYQNQYKKCTNDPISEQEKLRSELLRPVARSKSAIPKQTIPRKPKVKSNTQRHYEKKQRRSREQRLEGRGNLLPAAPSSASLNPFLGANFETFDGKLKHVRGCSPRSRRRMAAEILQWQAAIATVEVEEPAPVPAPVNVKPLPASLNNNYLHTPSQPASPSVLRATSVRFAAPHFSSSLAGAGDTSYGAEQTYDPMDEDEGEGEQEDEDEGTPWAGPNHTGPSIKAPQ